MPTPTQSFMDDTTRSIIERITVSYSEPQKIPSGHSCKVYYDCASLSPSDLARLAAQATGHLAEGEFDMVLGIAYTGVFFAAAVAGGKPAAILQIDGELFGPSLKGHRILVVDDVLHSGRRMREAAKKAEASGATVVGYACIVDRSSGSVSKSNVPVWSACQTTME